MCFYQVPLLIFIHQIALEMILTQSHIGVGKVVKVQQFHLVCVLKVARQFLSYEPK